MPVELLDLVAIGTIADMVSLTGENRILVTNGLKMIQQTERAGLSALIEVSGLKKRAINETDIGFAIGPRLNAIGRLEDANPAVTLMSTFDPEEAQGVLGIVAGRLMQQTGRPVLVLTKKSNGIAKGSGRSVAALNLFDMLSGMREMFTSFGGHHAAVGLSVPIDHLSMLQERMNQYVVDNRIDLSSGIPLPIDEELSLAEITTNFIESLKILAPFGTDNPIPKFLITNISADNGRQIGTENQHLKVSLTDGENGQLDVIGFGFGSQLVEFESEGLAVVGQLSVNEWNGKKKPQLMLEDFEVNGIQLFDLRSKKNRQGLILDAQTLGIAFSDKLPSEIERFCPNVHVYQTLDDLTAFFGSGNYTQLAFLDCPSEKELLRKIIQEIPVNRIYLILVSTEDAYP